MTYDETSGISVYTYRLMVSKSKAHALVARVKYSVVLAHEDIAKDPQRTSRGCQTNTRQLVHYVLHRGDAHPLPGMSRAMRPSRQISPSGMR